LRRPGPWSPAHHLVGVCLAASCWLAITLAGCAPAPSTRLPALQAPPPVGPGGFRRLTLGLCEDYPEETRSQDEVRRDLALMREAGVAVLRVSVGWDGLEPRRNSYDWSFLDQLVAQAEAAGVRLIPYVAYTPAWNAPPGAADPWRQPPRDLDAFAAVMQRLAARYRGRIHSWEIWNEPDNADYWRGTPAAYAALLRAGTEGVRRGDPAARVVLGGLAGDLAFLRTLFEQQGVAELVDVVNLHSYFETWNEDALETLPEYVAAAAEVVRRHGGRQALWMAEVGYSDYRGGAASGPPARLPHAYQHTPDFQAVALVRTLALLMATPDIALAAWYELKDPSPTMAVIGDDNNRHLGVAAHDHRPKPALAALRFLASLLALPFAPCPGCVQVQRAGDAGGVVETFAMADGSYLLFAWIPERGPGSQGRRHTLRLSLPAVMVAATLYRPDGSIERVLPLRQQASSTVVDDVEVNRGAVAIVRLAPVRAATPASRPGRTFR
jgi:hypothetical protein